jgi:hypothetical protein
MTHEELLRALAERGFGDNPGYDYDLLTDAEEAACLAGAEALRREKDWREALSLLLREVEESGCAGDDFGWPKAIKAARALLATEVTR